MQFPESDLDMILETTGEQVQILLSGTVVSTPWGKFRENFESLQPFESTKAIHHPTLVMKSSVVATLTSSHSFLVRGVEYKFDGKPEHQPSGFSMVHLGVKK